MLAMTAHARFTSARRRTSTTTATSASASGAAPDPSVDPKTDCISGPDPPPPYCPAVSLQSRLAAASAATPVIDDDDDDDDDDEALPDYCECPTLSCPSISFDPPSYTKHTPLGLFPPWKATRPRTLHVRRSRANSASRRRYSVSFPSGNLVLEAKAQAAEGDDGDGVALTAPRISTPPLDLVQGAASRNTFEMRDQEGVAMVCVAWSGNRGDVRFPNVLGHTGPAHLDVQVVNASLGVITIKSGDRCVARLSQCGNSWVECLVEEGMDALVVVVVALTMLMMPLVPKRNAKSARHERRALLWSGFLFG